MKPKILLVEDSPEIQMIVEGALASSGAELTKASNGKETKDYLAHAVPDLILLDVKLPDADGFELCLEIKKNPKLKSTPVIFLTSKSDVSDKVAAFSLGAEDYIVKPFHVLEFRARIEARLKRLKEEKTPIEEYEIDGFRFDLAAQRAYSDRELLDLTHLEFKLFYHLAKNPDRVFSRDQLLSTVWGSHIHVVDRTVDAHVCTLRKKLTQRSKAIESVPGTGYRYAPQAAAARPAFKSAVK